jgi:hypothetical protein
MKNRLNEILTTINGSYHYVDETAHQYISLIHEAIEIMHGLQTTQVSMLEDAKNDALTKLSHELTNRLNESFFTLSLERRKSEFKISRMLVGVAIGNVLSNMSAD